MSSGKNNTERKKTPSMGSLGAKSTKSARHRESDMYVLKQTEWEIKFLSIVTRNKWQLVLVVVFLFNKMPFKVAFKTPKKIPL